MSTRRDTTNIQERIVNAILGNGAGVLRGEIAAAAGVNASQVSHWTDDGDGHRQVRMPELIRLIRRWGADVVLAPLAAISGCVVVKVDAGAGACLDSLRRALWPAMGHMERHLSPGSAAGVGLTREEALEGLPSVEAWAEEAIRCRDAYRAAAQGRAA